MNGPVIVEARLREDNDLAASAHIGLSKCPARVRCGPHFRGGLDTKPRELVERAGGKSNLNLKVADFRHINLH